MFSFFSKRIFSNIIQYNFEILLIVSYLDEEICIDSVQISRYWDRRILGLQDLYFMCKLRLVIRQSHVHTLCYMEGVHREARYRLSCSQVPSSSIQDLNVELVKMYTNNVKLTLNSTCLYMKHLCFSYLSLSNVLNMYELNQYTHDVRNL